MRRPGNALLLAVTFAACRAHMPPPLTPPFSFPMTESVRAVRELESRQAEYLAGPDAWMYWQAVAQYRSLAGDRAGALEAWDRAIPPREAEAPSLEGFGPEPAADVVLREAERRRAVFLNEAHHDARHRDFTRSLLAGLRARGYRYFAAEAFSPDAAEKAAAGEPPESWGGYLSEASFSALAAEARSQGFELVAYEEEGEPCTDPPGDPQFCANRRDRAQAENLKARVFDKDPGAKLVVHAGFDHVRKDGRGAWKTMAGEFRRLTGTDPLSVDQVELSSRGSEARDPAALRAVVAAFRPEGPVILSSSDGRGWLLPGDEAAYDFHVVHPRASR